MFNVTLVNLSADASAADTAHDRSDLGELPAAQVQALLEQFARLDAVSNADAEPQINLSVRSGKFIVRTGRGKLFLYNARDSAQPYAELTAAEIVSQLLGEADFAGSEAYTVEEKAINSAIAIRKKTFIGPPDSGYDLVHRYQVQKVTFDIVHSGVS